MALASEWSQPPRHLLVSPEFWKVPGGAAKRVPGPPHRDIGEGGSSLGPAGPPCLRPLAGPQASQRGWKSSGPGPLAVTEGKLPLVTTGRTQRQNKHWRPAGLAPHCWEQLRGQHRQPRLREGRPLCNAVTPDPERVGETGLVQRGPGRGGIDPGLHAKVSQLCFIPEPGRYRGVRHIVTPRRGFWRPPPGAEWRLI